MREKLFAVDRILRRERKYVFGVCVCILRGAIVRLRQAAVCWAAVCVSVCVCVCVCV